jgi:hypothetical protein
MKVSSKTDPKMLRREADECTELLSRATFIGIIALLMAHADTCRIMADRIDEAQRRPSGAEWGQVLAGAELKKTRNARREG